MTDLLGYLAFGGSLCSAWLYGKQGVRGPIAGLATSVAFMAFGYASGVHAAIISNIVFMFVHLRNLKNALENDMERTRSKISTGIDYIVEQAHNASVDAGWWVNTDLTDRHVVPAKLCLIHSEISEAMEGHRKDLMDDKLPHRKMIEVELADAMIRIADLAGALNLDLGGAVAEKIEFNKVRPDHKPENRTGTNGKAY